MLFARLVLVTSLVSTISLPRAHADEWLNWSGDLTNNHHREVSGSAIQRDTVHLLARDWVFKTKNSVSTTPTVKNGVIYFPELANTGLRGLFSGGKLYAADAVTGKQIWSHDVLDYTGVHVRNFTRSSPAIADDLLILGDSMNNVKFIAKITAAKVSLNRKKHLLKQLQTIPGTSVFAVRRKDGTMAWKTTVDEHFSSRITMSPVVHAGKIYVGISSEESQIPGVAGMDFKCCDFRGSLVALDAKTGKILWKTYMLSEEAVHAGFSGAAVWGGLTPIDEKRNSIYIGTGNNYQTPPDYQACLLAAANFKSGREAAESACHVKFDRADNRFDSIVALDLDTGKIKWTFKSTPYDAWNVGCGSRTTKIPKEHKGTCPNPKGGDSDFAQAPMLLRDIEIAGTKRDLLVVGQKSGNVYALNAEDGSVLWRTTDETKDLGGDLGGHQWGAATDGKLAYFQTSNLEHDPITLTAGLYKGQTINSGYWVARDVKTGAIVWQTPDPSHVLPLTGHIKNLIFGGIGSLIRGNLGMGHFAATVGPLTLYNGIIFAGSMTGHLYALDSDTGKILWDYYDQNGSAVSAPSIVNDRLYWGVGYVLGFPDREMMSFSIPRK